MVYMLFNTDSKQIRRRRDVGAGRRHPPRNGNHKTKPKKLKPHKKPKKHSSCW